MATNICASRVCMMIEYTSSMPQNYINCQKLHRSSCVLTTFCIPSSRANKISQTAQPLGSHIYSTNVDIPRLWHDISRLLMHLSDKNILLMKHWKCKVCLYFWFILCETGRLSNCFSYSTTGWASDRLVDVHCILRHQILIFFEKLALSSYNILPLQSMIFQLSVCGSISSIKHGTLETKTCF